MYVAYSPTQVKSLMRQKGLTTLDVARRARGQLSQPTVSRLASGKLRSAQHAKLEALAKVLKVPVENLLKENTPSG